MGEGESRKTKRARAAKERARETHARLIVQRQGDPRFVHQTRTETGRTIHLRPQEIELLRRQRESFVAKFGREPTGDDPLFFDPDQDVPVALDEEAMFAELYAATKRAGVDTAFIQAWHEVGYLITDDNRHLFSAHEIEAYEDAVQRAWDRAEADPDGESLKDDDADRGHVIDLSEERVSAARESVLERLGLHDEQTIAMARTSLAGQIGRVIRHGRDEDGDPFAEVEIIGTSIYRPVESDSVEEHVENVASTLREESLDWLDGKRRHHVDSTRMPALADFIALGTDAQLIAWVQTNSMAKRPYSHRSSRRVGRGERRHDESSGLRAGEHAQRAACGS